MAMTKFKSLTTILSGIVMILVGILVILTAYQDGLKVVLVIIQFGMTVRGIRTLYYYLSMAKYMVGGRNVLYRSLILLDLGIVAGSLYDHPVVFAVVYIALLHIFSGAVSVLRANESRQHGAHWRFKMAYGVTQLLMAIAVLVTGAVMKQPIVTAYIYGFGLMYSALLRIISAFRRTAIVYIQ